MLATKKSAGVAPEVNLWGIHWMQVRNMQGATLALENREDITRRSKQVYQWPHKKGLMSSKFFLKK